MGIGPHSSSSCFLLLLTRSASATSACGKRSPVNHDGGNVGLQVCRIRHGRGRRRCEGVAGLFSYFHLPHNRQRTYRQQVPITPAATGFGLGPKAPNCTPVVARKAIFYSFTPARLAQPCRQLPGELTSFFAQPRECRFPSHAMPRTEYRALITLRSS